MTTKQTIPSVTTDSLENLPLALLEDEDDGEAARSHLAAGRWVTYRDPTYSYLLVREWPDGRRELVHADVDGNVRVLQSI